MAYYRAEKGRNGTLQRQERAGKGERGAGGLTIELKRAGKEQSKEEKRERKKKGQGDVGVMKD